jgi:hypothetical protein
LGGNHKNEVPKGKYTPETRGAGEKENGRISEWPVTLRVHVPAAAATANETIPGHLAEGNMMEVVLFGTEQTKGRGEGKGQQ